MVQVGSGPEYGIRFRMADLNPTSSEIRLNIIIGIVIISAVLNNIT